MPSVLAIRPWASIHLLHLWALVIVVIRCWAATRRASARGSGTREATAKSATQLAGELPDSCHHLRVVLILGECIGILHDLLKGLHHLGIAHGRHDIRVAHQPGDKVWIHASGHSGHTSRHSRHASWHATRHSSWHATRHAAHTSKREATAGRPCCFLVHLLLPLVLFDCTLLSLRCFFHLAGAVNFLLLDFNSPLLGKDLLPLLLNSLRQILCIVIKIQLQPHSQVFVGQLPILHPCVCLAPKLVSISTIRVLLKRRGAVADAAKGPLHGEQDLCALCVHQR
mmetsp:Transcript_54315/g.119092  ORF Transcript_54315/g.119092 Transcript_54315/m.119092 type:complete len:283 (+) Transcript_54315:272-1120(+)